MRMRTFFIAILMMSSPAFACEIAAPTAVASDSGRETIQSDLAQAEQNLVLYNEKHPDDILTETKRNGVIPGPGVEVIDPRDTFKKAVTDLKAKLVVYNETHPNNNLVDMDGYKRIYDACELKHYNGVKPSPVPCGTLPVIKECAHEAFEASKKESSHE